MQYRSEVVSVAGFVQQIACSYLRHGYWFYVTGRIPAGKDVNSVDRKLVEKYAIDVSESTRARRKQAGQANLQYLRHDRTFAIFATKGEHRFFEEEASSIRDIRRIPIRYSGYSISYRRGGRTRDGAADHRWHAHVEIDRQVYLGIRAYLMELAVHRSVEKLVMEFYELPFEPYAPIRRQLLTLIRSVNRIRHRAGYRLVPVEVLPLRRRIVRPFGDDHRLMHTVHDSGGEPEAEPAPMPERVGPHRTWKGKRQASQGRERHSDSTLEQLRRREIAHANTAD